MKWISDPVSDVLLSGGFSDSSDSCWSVCDCRKGFSCACHKSRLKKKKKKKNEGKKPKKQNALILNEFHKAPVKKAWEVALFACPFSGYLIELPWYPGIIWITHRRGFLEKMNHIVKLDVGKTPELSGIENEESPVSTFGKSRGNCNTT